MLDQQQQILLSQKVQTVLGDRLLNITKPEAGILNHALESVLMDNNGQADQVTPEEIEGAWEMIDEVWGPAFNEEYLNSNR